MACFNQFVYGKVWDIDTHTNALYTHLYIYSYLLVQLFYSFNKLILDLLYPIKHCFMRQE